ncbi:MAG: hypothetical protein IE931_14925 [Sphingobacteriales bacterium]|nr:hypothetical protein [Sphingobacteriales bacterium]MBD3822036.1 hypothetical protein [Thiotrichales bacterium]
MEKVNVICLKWGSKYPAEDVNKLYSMVKRNLSIPFDFYCITENSDELLEGIKILPLYDESLTGWWHKLSIYRKDFYGLNGTALFLDLDVVITDRLNALFEYKPGRTCSIADKGGSKWNVINSSVVRFEIGELDYVWQGFQYNHEWIMQNMHGDQDWLGLVVPSVELYPAGWAVSYKKECQSKGWKALGHVGEWLMKKGYLKPFGEAVLPEQAKVVIFHGKPDPVDVAYGPYKQWKKATWIQKFWKQES